MRIPQDIKNQIQYFFKISTLHGLKYIGQPSISTVERMFWLVAFSCAAGFAGYFSGSILDKYINNRVIISMNSKPISADDIPFPTVTICNMNRVSKERAEIVMINGTIKEKMYIKKLCNFKITEAYPIVTEQEKRDFMDFLLKISPTCEETIKTCTWNHQKVKCNEIFKITYTDVGVCYSFNQLPLNYIFRCPLSVDETNLTETSLDWTLENGYTINATQDSIPFRLKGAGLTVLLDAKLEDYYCSSTSSNGFQILTLNPVEWAYMKNFGTNIGPGMESSLSLVPLIDDAEDSLRFVSSRYRECYFKNERKLSVYNTYTLKNCITECRINYTLKYCNCVQYYLKSNISRICGNEHNKCITNAYDLIESAEKLLDEKSLCKCLPGCYELKYSKHMFYGRFVNNSDLSEGMIFNRSTDYFIKNAAILNIFYPALTINRSTKSEIYGHLELLANMGGLLAIFLGFSFLSAAEIVYHFGYKIFPKLGKLIVKNWVEQRRPYPFVK